MNSKPATIVLFGFLFSVSQALAGPVLTTLVTFGDNNSVRPMSGLIFDSAGNLYGTTQGSVGGGTVFKIAAGTTTLSTIVGFNAVNGANPSADLIADASGNLYGTTEFGEAGNVGSVFKIAAGTHTFSTLAALDKTNGSNSEAALFMDKSGNLYGTALRDGPNGFGTVFKVAAGTNALSTVVAFNVSNGPYPEGGLIAD